MPYLLWQKLYTDAESVADRLEKRLQVGGSQNALGKSVVNEGLLNSVGAQVEARITAHLSRCYKTPLLLNNNLSRGVLASIAEKGILAEILPPTFIGEYGKEGSLRLIMAQEFEEELAKICPGGLKLAGEILLADANTEDGNTTVVGRRVSQHQHGRAIEGESRYSRCHDTDYRRSPLSYRPTYDHKDADQVRW